MIEGILLGESVRLDRPLEGVSLSVKKVSRSHAGDIEAGQPMTWTFIHFEAPDDEADTLLVATSLPLAPFLVYSWCEATRDEDAGSRRTPA